MNLQQSKKRSVKLVVSDGLRLMLEQDQARRRRVRCDGT